MRRSFRAALRDPCSGLRGRKKPPQYRINRRRGSQYSPTMEGAGEVVELQREREGEGEEAKRVTTARVEKRDEGGKVEKSQVPRTRRVCAGSERIHVGGGNLRQEAWSVRRSHPTALHREATLIVDVLEATMDVGHDDCSETYVGGGWKDATWSIRRIFIFLTLSLTIRLHLFIPLSSVHSRMDALLSSHRDIATSLSRTKPLHSSSFSFYYSSRFFFLKQHETKIARR